MPASEAAENTPPPAKIVLVAAEPEQRWGAAPLCFVSAGRTRLVPARLYQGQTTNFRTPGGGFAPVFVA